jgi:hypothetical protein
MLGEMWGYLGEGAGQLYENGRQLTPSCAGTRPLLGVRRPVAAFYSFGAVKPAPTKRRQAAAPHGVERLPFDTGLLNRVRTLR